MSDAPDYAVLTKAERVAVVVRAFGVRHTEAKIALVAAGWDVRTAFDYLRRKSVLK
jgi:hypothetical protein